MQNEAPKRVYLAPSGPRVPIAYALRRAFARGYGLPELRADALAGSVVGIVAIPLSMALGIAVGAPPQNGLYTAVVAGIVVALCGGSKFQVTGPTAAFVVILAPIMSRFGLSGLLTAGFMAGAMLVALGLARLGRLMQFIPQPVTTGFTTGIAVVIATLQIKDVLGLSMAAMPDHYLDKVAALWQARGSAQGAELCVALVTLGLLVGLPRVIRSIPAPLLAIALVSALVAAVREFAPGVSVATIGSRFQTQIDGVMVHGIPSVLPSPELPWRGAFSLARVRELLPPAVAIALLGAIESLLSATIADGMTGTRHDPNAELVGLGIGNMLGALFGGIAATGALARTATNIRAGARSPLAAVFHSLVVLACIVLLAPSVAHVPMAALATLLLMVAWNMSELHSFLRLLRTTPKSDVFVLVTCFGLTVFFDMVVAVSVGVLLAALLFMRRMAELTETRAFFGDGAESEPSPLPPGVMSFAVRGPLFFGAAQGAVAALHAARRDDYSVMILDLRDVPIIDATGVVALDNAIGELIRLRHRVVLAGLSPRPGRVIAKAALEARHPGLHIEPRMENAIELAGQLARSPLP